MTTKKSKRVRKPREVKRGDIYAGIFNGDCGRRIYIGGAHYEGYHQIHLTPEEAISLHAWLGRAIKYLEQEKK